MAVIINDFEVVSEPPPPEERGGGGGGDAEGQAAGGQGPTPHEVEHVIERQRERRARVWAH